MQTLPVLVRSSSIECRWMKGAALQIGIVARAGAKQEMKHTDACQFHTQGAMTNRGSDRLGLGQCWIALGWGLAACRTGASGGAASERVARSLDGGRQVDKGAAVACGGRRLLRLLLLRGRRRLAHGSCRLLLDRRQRCGRRAGRRLPVSLSFVLCGRRRRHGSRHCNQAAAAAAVAGGGSAGDAGTQRAGACGRHRRANRHGTQGSARAARRHRTACRISGAQPPCGLRRSDRMRAHLKLTAASLGPAR